jgi:tRNA 2-selenouridine synthase SelU
MNKEEVEKALEDLKQQYSPVTINITPEKESGETRERLLEADSAMDEDFDDEASLH